MRLERLLGCTLCFPILLLPPLQIQLRAHRSLVAIVFSPPNLFFNLQGNKWSQLCVNISSQRLFLFITLWHAYSTIIQVLRHNICPDPLIIDLVSAPFRMFTDCSCAIALVVAFWSLFRGQGESTESALERLSGCEHESVGTPFVLCDAVKGKEAKR